MHLKKYILALFSLYRTQHYSSTLSVHTTIVCANTWAACPRVRLWSLAARMSGAGAASRIRPPPPPQDCLGPSGAREDRRSRRRPP